MTVQFRRSFAAAKVYDPTAGTEPIQTLGRADSLKLTLSDHPFIVTLAQE